LIGWREGINGLGTNETILGIGSPWFWQIYFWFWQIYFASFVFRRFTMGLSGLMPAMWRRHETYCHINLATRGRTPAPPLPLMRRGTQALRWPRDAGVLPCSVPLLWSASVFMVPALAHGARGALLSGARLRPPALGARPHRHLCSNSWCGSPPTCSAASPVQWAAWRHHGAPVARVLDALVPEGIDVPMCFCGSLCKFMQSEILGDDYGMRFFMCENYEYDPPKRYGKDRAKVAGQHTLFFFVTYH